MGTGTTEPARGRQVRRLWMVARHPARVPGARGRRRLRDVVAGPAVRRRSHVHRRAGRRDGPRRDLRGPSRGDVGPADVRALPRRGAGRAGERRAAVRGRGMGRGRGRPPVHRPPEIPGLPLLLTALAGLAANVVVFLLLREGAKESLNLPRGLPRGARRPARFGRGPARRRRHADHRVGLRGPAGRDRDRALRGPSGGRAGPPGGADTRAGRAGARRRAAAACARAGRPAGGARRPRRARVDPHLGHGGRVGAPVGRRGGGPGRGAVRGAPARPTATGCALHGAGRAAGVHARATW